MLKPTQDKKALKEVTSILELAYKQDINDPEWGKNGFISYWSMELLNRLEKLGYHIGLPPSIEEALNSGDGVYRP